MLVKIADGLYVGDEAECRMPGEPALWAGVLHACKSPCHQLFANYVGRRALPHTHSEYLWARRETHLALNIIDPPAPLFKREVFGAALDFLDEYMGKGDVLLHCNGGLSRAPSIALLYLAKRLGALPDTSYTDAAVAFRAERMRTYEPGLGIRMFLEMTWTEIT